MKQPDDITLRTYSPTKVTDRPGPGSAGQSGDDMGLSTDETAGSESVSELVGEGQYYEAEAVSGLERPYPDEEGVRTHEVPEDDVPLEYPPKTPLWKLTSQTYDILKQREAFSLQDSLTH